MFTRNTPGIASSMDISHCLSLTVMLIGLTTPQSTVKYGYSVNDDSCMAQYAKMSLSVSKLSKDIEEIKKTLNTQPNDVAKKESQYQMFQTKKKWMDADLSCSVLGGHLVSFEDLEELDAVSNRTEPCPGAYGYWTAGRDIGNETWIWRNSGDPIATDLWHSGEPNTSDDYCVILWTEPSRYALADNKCHHEMCYICEI